MNVTEAIKTRISVRAFKPDPIPEALVREILDVARFAPSGGNLQPWKVIAVAGAERDAVVALARANLPGDEGERLVYPANLWEPYRTRRYKLGEDMYAKLEIPRENKGARLMHLAENFNFFGAPVGLFFVIEKAMGHGQWAHLGMFMQSVALTAIERGVQSCMQEAWARVRTPLAAHFSLRDEEMIYCGMALGYADTAKPVNALRSDRAEVDEIAEFRGF
ncbi:nitroreductase [Terricaulis silvestris]|uniref:NADH dehydrogenase n=1 Tax=Terricaulis silvestris TaxID=2686094 RepID=A0A6I6MNB3_9CAUL|nr:nitroreductase [Terricaulis silvestris]QGZ94828.1 NADH dehydrogenase [Terricaulis silvestris]